MIVAVENRVCAPGLEERELGSSRNVALLYVPYMLTGEAALSDVRRRIGDGICQTKTATFSPLSMVHEPVQVWCFQWVQHATAQPDPVEIGAVPPPPTEGAK